MPRNAGGARYHPARKATGESHHNGAAMTLRRGPVTPRAVVLGATVLLCALGLRLGSVSSTPVYPDEAMVVELAMHIARGEVMAVGALTQGAFSPLASSPLAPAGAAMVMRASGLNPLTAARLWVALLAAGTSVALLWALWPLRPTPWLAVGAAMIHGCLPLSVGLGRWAFYHHLGALLVAIVLGLSVREQRTPRLWLLVVIALVCSTTVVSAYWTLWLVAIPILLAAAPPGRRITRLAVAASACLAPFLVYLAWAWWMQGDDLAADARELWQQSGPAGITAPARLALGFWHAARANPFLVLAAVGMVASIAGDVDRQERASAWVIAAIAVVTWLEPFRQRQNIDAVAYPLILVLPLAAVGLAAFVLWPLRLTGRRRFVGVALAACLALAAAQRPMALTRMAQASAPLDETTALFDAIAQRTPAGSMVIATTTFNWRAAPANLRVSDLEQVAAYRGDRSYFVRPQLPSRAFVFAPELATASLLIVSHIDRLHTFQQEAPRRLILRVEAERWPLVWSSEHYQVYANPRFSGTRAETMPRILGLRDLYALAATDALARGEADLAAVACERLAPGPTPCGK